MLLYRLAKQRYAQLDGEGARLYGARWNSAGRPVVYTATSRSLALVEQLVRIDPEEIPNDFATVVIELPDNLSMITLSFNQFPDNWQQPEHAPWFKQQGDEWLIQRHSLALSVPSIIIPEETNILLNPRHPQMQKVRLHEIKPFIFDTRFF